MNFLELLQPQGDKATLNEIVKAKKLLPKTTTKSIPTCLWDDNDDIDEEVVIVLSFVRALRENKDIALEEVGDRIGNKSPDAFNPIIRELLYFYTTDTAEAIEERYNEAEAKVSEEPSEVEKPAEDPTV